MAASARAWSVAKLKELNFEGDAEALGQYIDAVIDNNREAENGDPELLRAQVTRDLHDFLADSAAAAFVDALMRHLSPKAPVSSPDPAASANGAPPAAAQQPLARPSTVDDKLRQPLPETRRRSPRRDRAEKSRAEADRADAAPRRPDRHERRPSRQTVMARLGDRAEDPREQHKRQRAREPKPSRDPREAHSREARPPPRHARDRDADRERDRPAAPPRAPRAAAGDVWERLGPRSVKRPREEPADVRERREADERDAKHRRGGADAARRRGDGFERARAPGDRARRDDRAARIAAPPPYDQNGKAPPPWPPNLVAQMGLMPPPFHGMLPPVPPLLPNMGAGAGAGGGVGGGGGAGGGSGRGGYRARDHVRALAQNGASNAPNGKHKHFILIAVHIPDDKMMIGPIYAFFQRFGILRDVQRFPPDKAFIMFERRESAQHAVSSVDAVMGNRHIRLRWARESDFAEAGLRLTDDGTLVEDEQGKRQQGREEEAKAASSPPRPEARSSAAEQRGRYDAEKGKKIREAAEQKERKMKEAEEDVRRKKEQIAELRRQQDERIAQLTTRKQQLLARQHEMFAKIATASEEEKMKMKNELAAIQEETVRVQQELKPKPVVPAKAEAMKRFAAASNVYRVDNRPRQVLVRGAKDALAVDVAAAAFHDTERAEQLGKGEWVVSFLSRRAAESAVRAQKVLKRCFGAGASAVIVSAAMVEAVKQSSGGGAEAAVDSSPASPPDVKADVSVMDDSVQAARSASAVAE